MNTEIKLNGKTYFFLGSRIYSYRLAVWGKQTFLEVPPNGPLAKKLLTIKAAKEIVSC